MKRDQLKTQDPLKILSWYLVIVLHLICASAVVILFKAAIKAIMY